MGHQVNDGHLLRHALRYEAIGILILDADTRDSVSRFPSHALHVNVRLLPGFAS